MNVNFDFQGSQNLSIRVAISQQSLYKRFQNLHQINI